MGIFMGHEFLVFVYSLIFHFFLQFATVEVHVLVKDDFRLVFCVDHIFSFFLFRYFL